MRKTTVGLAQMACTDDPAVNVATAERLVREAAVRGARIVCLPELFRTRYFCQREDHAFFELAEPIPGPTTQLFETLAAELDIAIIASLFEKRAEGLYHNTAAVIDGKKGYLGKYRKMHIPDDPQFYEKFYFTPGDLGFRTFQTGAGPIGTLVCWDQWYPEAARLTALRGANILFYPTAIGWLPEEREERGDAQHDAWELVQRAHAVTNGCYVAAVNRYGYEPADEKHGIQFWGQSFIADPYGRVLDRAPADQEAVLVCEIDIDMVNAFRTEWPFLRDRRIDAYGGLVHRFIDDTP